MKKKTLWMIGIIAMLASCSQNETVLEADNRSVTVITAAVDNGMKTRAATVSDDDAVTRCLVQVLKDGNSVGAPIAGVEGDAGYTFTVPGLDDSETYTFLFWADGGEAYYTASDLKAITVAESAKTGGIGIAYSCKVEATKATIAATPSTLTHAVSKITLMTTGALPEGKKVAMTVPTYYSFNVATSTAEGDKAEYLKESTNAVNIPDGATSAHVFSVYVLGQAGAASESVKIVYNEQEDGSESVGNLPISPNKHITLSGDVSSLKTDLTITASMDTNWNDQNEDFPQNVTE